MHVELSLSRLSLVSTGQLSVCALYSLGPTLSFAALSMSPACVGVRLYAPPTSICKRSFRRCCCGDLACPSLAIPPERRVERLDGCLPETTHQDANGQVEQARKRQGALPAALQPGVP